MVLRFNYRYQIILVLILLFPIGGLVSGSACCELSHPQIPQTGQQYEGTPFLYTDTIFKRFNEFIGWITNEDGRRLVEIHVEDVFALSVTEQPSGEPDYVSPDAQLLTKYGLAERFGTHGILAHNFLAGQYFFELEPGMTVKAVYGDGGMSLFRVKASYGFQALSPHDVHSSFIALDGSGKIYTSNNLFYRMYNHPGDLVLQTCIARDGNQSWGRHFVIAEKINREK